MCKVFIFGTLLLVFAAQSILAGPMNSINLNTEEAVLNSNGNISSYNTDVCFKGNLYYFHRETRTKVVRSKAADICRNMRMQLVNVQTAEKNDFIVDQIRKFGLDGHAFWTSGWKNGNLWFWGNNDVFTYTNWRAGEPNYRKNENCVNYVAHHMKWNDEKCNFKYLYVCESTLPC